MRQNPTPFIQKRPNQFFNEQTSNRLAAILGNVGRAAATVASTVAEDQQREAAKQAALVKLRDSERVAQLEKSEAETRLAISDENLARQSADIARRRAEEAIADIEELERHDVWASVNRLSEDELDTASAFNLGFRSKEAIRAVNVAIGQRAANRDLPALQTRIATDFSKTGSEHLNEWLSDNKLEGDEANLAYVEALTTRLRDDVASRQRRDIANNARNNRYLALDELNYQIATNFDIATRETLIPSLRRTAEQIRATDPTITDAEVFDEMIAAIEPVLVGPEARFSSEEVLVKLGQVFESQEELEAFGFGGIAARAMASIERRAKAEADSVFSLAKRQIEAAPSHEHLRAVQEATRNDPRLNGLQRQELNLLIEDGLSRPDYMTEVERRFNGDTSIAIGSGHDEAIVAFFNEQAGDENFDPALRNADAARAFGYIPDAYVQEINDLSASGDDGEAINLFAAIRAEDPRLAETLKGRVSNKVYAMTMIAELGVPNAEGFIQSFANVDEGDFEKAIDLFEKRDEDGEILGASANRSLVGMTRKAIGRDSDSNIVLDGSVVRTFEQLMYAGIATQLANEGADDPALLIEDAAAFAKATLGKHVSSVKLGGDTYAITKPQERAFGFALAEDAYRREVDQLWRATKGDLETVYGDVLLDFAETRIEDKDGRPYAFVPIAVEDQLFGTGYVGTFEFPLGSPSELKRLVDAREKIEAEAEEQAPTSPLDGREFYDFGPREGQLRPEPDPLRNLGPMY